MQSPGLFNFGYKTDVANGETLEVKPLIEYFKASRVELTKVTWPSRRNTVKLTFTVIAFSIAFALLLGGLDTVFTGLVQKVIVKG